jgi:hypothetical protein
MVKDTTNYTTKRSFLKTGIGASASFIVAGGISSASSPPTVEVPAFLHDGEPIQYMAVEEAWKSYSDKVKVALEKVKNRYIQSQEVFMVEETSSDEKIPGTAVNKPDITVYAAKDSSRAVLRTVVPPQVDGVTVNRESFPGFINTAYRDTYDPVPGGVEAKDPNGDDSYDTFTTTCKVTYNDNPRFLFVRHPFTDDIIGETADPKRCETNGIGEQSCYQGSDIMGVTKAEWQKFDVTLIKRDNLSEKSGFENTIVDEVGSIEGVISSNRLDYLKDNSYDYPDRIRKRGIVSGATQGEVLGTGGTIPCNDEGQDIKESVRTSNLQYTGDSGGPRYERYQNSTTDYDIYIAGPATQANGNSESQGVAAWYLNQETGMIFG